MPLSPQYQQLLQQTQQQDVDAVQAAVRQDSANLTARYGALTSGDTAAILARYGTRLALANNGGATASMLKSG